MDFYDLVIPELIYGDYGDYIHYNHIIITQIFLFVLLMNVEGLEP